MVDSRKVFKAATADTTEPIEFGVELTNRAGEKREMTFAAIGTAPGDAVMVLTRMGRVTKDGVATIDGSGMSEFMDYALTDESATRWREMVADREWMLPADVVGEVITYIQEQWAARPTVRSPSSSPGRPTTSLSSTGPAS